MTTALRPEFDAVRPHLSSIDTESFMRPVLRFRWEAVPVPALDSVAAVRDRLLLVLGDQAGLVAGVARVLRAAGARVDECTPESEPAPADWDGIIDLNVTGMRGDGWPGALIRSTRMLQHRYADWRAQSRADHCCYLAVTELGGRMGYDESVSPQPHGGIWAGLAKCLPRELPNLAVKVLDIADPSPETLGELIIREMSGWDLYEVGYRDGDRYALTARPRDVGSARLDLDAGDLVLISGGGRGVGFALARGLAETTGCQVVVTGRRALPVDASWLDQDEAGYAEFCRARVAAARTAGELRAARAVQRREAELRSVRNNLVAAAAQGLRISYEPCDVGEPAQVDALFARLPAPTVIVHNAGIDEPKRLDLKDPADVVRTVHVKVAGYANLVAAVRADPARRAALRVFCNVGSLAGRMGGMIGQIDYAAGNEALARLGLCTPDLPVQTLCWPTWERLGVIANYDAAVRYVSTIDPADGVRRWIAELRAGSTGEIMFIGQVGAALVPSQLRGFWLFTGHPDLPRLHGLMFFLGRVTDFEPFRRIRSVLGYAAGRHPCLTEFRVGGSYAVPISVLLEQICGVADWVVPEGWPPQHLGEIVDITVHPSALVLAETGETRFVTTATGAHTEPGWEVTVQVTTEAEAPVASARLRYRPDPPEIAAPTETHPENGVPARNSAWTGLLFPPWSGPDTPLPALSGADLWTSPFPPRHGIAPAAVELAVQCVPAAPATPLRIRRIVAASGAQHVDRLIRIGPDTWLGEHTGHPVLRIEGLGPLE